MQVEWRGVKELPSLGLCFGCFLPSSITILFRSLGSGDHCRPNFERERDRDRERDCCGRRVLTCFDLVCGGVCLLQTAEKEVSSPLVGLHVSSVEVTLVGEQDARAALNVVGRAPVIPNQHHKDFTALLPEPSPCLLLRYAPKQASYQNCLFSSSSRFSRFSIFRKTTVVFL
jgi:hypothetical protein